VEVESEVPPPEAVESKSVTTAVKVIDTIVDVTVIVPLLVVLIASLELNVEESS
jgi:hypothetical protein